MDGILTNFDIVFNKSGASYREGDEISGEVVVDLREDIVVESKFNNLFYRIKIVLLMLLLGIFIRNAVQLRS